MDSNTSCNHNAASPYKRGGSMLHIKRSPRTSAKSPDFRRSGRRSLRKNHSSNNIFRSPPVGRRFPPHSRPPEWMTQMPHLEYIGECAFQDCKELEEIILPNSLQKIDNLAFSGCEKLAKVQLPAHGIEIAENAFEGTIYGHRKL